MSARQKQKTLNSKNSGRFLHIRNLRSVEGILIVATNRPKDTESRKTLSVDKLWRKLKIISSSLSSAISRQRGYPNWLYRFYITQTAGRLDKATANLNYEDCALNQMRCDVRRPTWLERETQERPQPTTTTKTTAIAVDWVREWSKVCSI